MNKIILIMGLPNSGKTTLANKLNHLINGVRLNADVVRRNHNDWDFSLKGTTRQAKRMFKLAKKLRKKNHVVVDFVCPTPESFKYFKADFLIWMNTIKKGRFKNMNEMFQKPKIFHIKVTSKKVDFWKFIILDELIRFSWGKKT